MTRAQVHNIIILNNQFLSNVHKKSLKQSSEQVSIITLFECHNYKTNQDFQCKNYIMFNMFQIRNKIVKECRLQLFFHDQLLTSSILLL